MEYVSRREWGARPARGSTVLQPARVNLLVLHHTVSRYSGAQSVRNIQNFHMDTNGWADLGYNWLVSPAGTVYEGRGWGMQGAHARGRNAESVGVAYIGDGREPVSDAAKFAILRLAAEADRRFGSLRRVGHRDVGSTVCPGDELYRWWLSGPSLPVAERSQDDARASEVLSEGCVPETGEVSSQRISEAPAATVGPPPVPLVRLPSVVPDVREGWRRHMGRMGWLRRK